MKCLIIIISIFFFQLPFHISGNYKVELDEQYRQSEDASLFINFTGKNYTKSDSIRGGITRIYNENSKTIIHLQDYVFSHPRPEKNINKPNGKVIIEFEESDFDTIRFRTTYNKQLDKTINTGRLIKIK